MHHDAVPINQAFCGGLELGLAGLASPHRSCPPARSPADRRLLSGWLSGRMGREGAGPPTASYHDRRGWPIPAFATRVPIVMGSDMPKREVASGVTLHDASSHPRHAPVACPYLLDPFLAISCFIPSLIATSLPL